jgi:hypothetical protein
VSPALRRFRFQAGPANAEGLGDLGGANRRSWPRRSETGLSFERTPNRRLCWYAVTRDTHRYASRSSSVRRVFAPQQSPLSRCRSWGVARYGAVPLQLPMNINDA